jgi:hypothetical protein
VVAAKNEEILGVLDLVCEKQADGLQGLLTSVDVIAEEEVVRFGWETAVLEQTEQVVVLSMYITTNLESCQLGSTTLPGAVRAELIATDFYRRFQLKQDGLADEDLARLGAQISDLKLFQLHCLAGPAATDLLELVYDGIQIHLVFRHSWDVLLAPV